MDLLLPRRTKKFLGQHWLQDNSTLERLVASIEPQRADQMVEIGAGPGILTTRLLPRVARLTAIEIDSDLGFFLQRNCGLSEKLQIQLQDVMTVDFFQFSARQRIVGNLPYNLATPILFHLVKYFTRIKDMVFMLQKEMAERIIARPGSKSYGRLSVMMQYYFEVVLLMRVSPSAFVPRPKVDSGVVKFTPRSQVLVDFPLFAELVRTAFLKRRKIIANGLGAYISADELSQLGIDPRQRPENLSVAQFVTVAEYLTALS